MRTDMSQVPVNRTRGKFRLIAAATVTTVLLAPGSVQSQATTCTVTSSNDSGPGTLREHLANAACSVINFDPSVTAIGLGSPLIIDRDVTVNGPWLPPDVYLYPERRVILGFGSRVFEVLANASAVVSGLGFHAARAPFGGGVILNRGTLTVSHSEFVTNDVTPAIDPEFGVERSIGGAIYNIGTLTVTHSFFTDNLANDGGAIYNRGSLEVINSSFVRNFDDAIFNVGDLTLTSSTITGNGTGLWQSTGSFSSKNSIIGGNFFADCEDIESSLSIQGVNFDTDGTCPQFQQVASADLRFGGFEGVADLLAGSVAIDAVSDCTLHDGVTPVGTDERGFPRPQGAFCDVGSFEFVQPFTFTGFFAPLHNEGLKVMKAGRAVEVKFSLGGDRGLGVLAPGFPASQRVDCNDSGDSSEVGQTVAASSSSFSYDAATDIYTYLWDTETSWAKTCRDLKLLFVDGSSQQIKFKFRK